MSLVTDVFDYVKTNPGTDGINLQNHFLMTMSQTLFLIWNQQMQLDGPTKDMS